MIQAQSSFDHYILDRFRTWVLLLENLFLLRAPDSSFWRRIAHSVLGSSMHFMFWPTRYLCHAGLNPASVGHKLLLSEKMSNGSCSGIQCINVIDCHLLDFCRVVYPYTFLKKRRGYCNRLRPSVRPSRYLLLNHWTKFNQIWCVSCSHE